MKWQIQSDAAWMISDANTYTHYCGASLCKGGELWTATTRAGKKLKPKRTATASFAALCADINAFWFFEMFDGHFGRTDLGGAQYYSKPFAEKIGGKELFMFRAPLEQSFPVHVLNFFYRYFVNRAVCLQCKLVVTGIAFHPLTQFDGLLVPYTYLTCSSCRYPVLQMENEDWVQIRDLFFQSTSSWRRKHHLAQAGGRHTSKEIRGLLKLQKSRCIYCSKKFTETNRPSKDHLLPITAGGTDWIYNIAVACRSCNLKRRDTPIGLYRKRLHSSQEQHLRAQLQCRLLALNAEDPTFEQAAESLVSALILHKIRHRSECNLSQPWPERYAMCSCEPDLPRNVKALLRRSLFG